MGLFKFVIGEYEYVGTSQYQPRLSSITIVDPGRSANQIAVFTSN